MLNLVKGENGRISITDTFELCQNGFSSETPPPSSYIKHSTIHVAFPKPAINRNCCLQLSALSVPVQSHEHAFASGVGCRCTCNMFMYSSVAR